jgi:monofunctional glycosyltransferase
MAKKTSGGDHGGDGGSGRKRVEPVMEAAAESPTGRAVAKTSRKPRRSRANGAGGETQGRVSRLRDWLDGLPRRAARLLLLLAAIPLLLAPLYGLPFVRPVSTLMLWDLVTLQGYDRQWRNIEDISPNLKNSVIISEDGQFCSHFGVDLRELRGVVEDALEGESPRGASTITMQVAKNLFLWNGRSFVRKALELPLALYIELVMPKRRIMEIYLNIAEWGPDNTYGIEAGVRRAFRIDADSMSRRQAALMTVALPNPHVRNPARPSRGMLSVARVVERRAAVAGVYVTCIQP